MRALCAGSRDFRPRRGSLLGRMRRLLLIPLTAALLALTPAMAGSRWSPAARTGSSGSRRRAPPTSSDYELMGGGDHERAPADELGRNRARSPRSLRPRLGRVRRTGGAGRRTRDTASSPSSGARPNGSRRGSAASRWQAPGSAGSGPASSAPPSIATARAAASGAKTATCRACPCTSGRSGTRRTSSPSPREPDPTRFARLIEISGGLLHRADPGSTVILGGLFGRPLQIPPNIQSGAFLSQLYRTPGSSATSMAWRCTRTWPMPARCEGRSKTCGG